ncbi:MULTISPECIES: hypothetical protein [unclassified Mesorhizobium]|uniref:hypothetical protein n=1 Tax=unclassified Mesorhizobium TaxID=325217 RepID=UPI000FD6D7C9|nr:MULTISPECIES: hypothetical protein [unclassified Mesorhizobium]TGT76732.1 hypothetical protein EN809_003770 [Mesorhizobium sp. M2E.F.Ca.ET.166.01.1.1]TGW02844.1 hypothetical protein EN797_003770 [Mesorhizobium sp. M2E.F.Ca.ET.154.01.1.1]
MVQMIAKKTVYYGRKEYRAGMQFSIDDEREIGKMERTNKAERVPEKPAKVDLPRRKTKVEEPEAPKPSGGRGRTYQRRDMVATDGQTGEEIPSPSSLQAHPSEEPTSTNSEAEPE